MGYINFSDYIITGQENFRSNSCLGKLMYLLCICSFWCGFQCTWDFSWSVFIQAVEQYVAWLGKCSNDDTNNIDDIYGLEEIVQILTMQQTNKKPKA